MYKRQVYAQPVSPRVSYNTPNLAGRWSLLQVEPLNDTERMLALAENMLDRYGIISRQAVIAENIPGGFPSMQTLCRSMEDSGRIMRGRFVEGLGLSLIHISEPTRLGMISYAVFCLKKKKK